MTATPARRRQILRDQKNPVAFKAARYKDARAAIVKFMKHGMIDVDEAHSTAVELRNDHSGTDFAVHDRQLSAEAIDGFLSISKKVEFDGLSVDGGDAFASEMLNIGGTKVSMRPDALLRDEATGDIVGCVKLNFSKTSPLQDKSAEYVATALRAHLEVNLSDPEH